MEVKETGFMPFIIFVENALLHFVHYLSYSNTLDCTAHTGKSSVIGGMATVSDIKYRWLWFPENWHICTLQTAFVSTQTSQSNSKEVSKEVKNRSMRKPGSQHKQLDRETQMGVSEQRRWFTMTSLMLWNLQSKLKFNLCRVTLQCDKCLPFPLWRKVMISCFTRLLTVTCGA